MNQLHRTDPFSIPIKFIQFGEGNFLRGFIDWQIELLNERSKLDAGVVVVRPRGHTVKPLLDTQGGLYTVMIQGLNEQGNAVREFQPIRCVQREINAVTMFDEFIALARNPDSRFVVSNTTEAGIAINNTDKLDDAPPASFPAKLTQLLHERYWHFKGAPDKGWVMLPCELIEHNGAALKAAVLHFAALWKLDAGFTDWIEHANTFCSTLVDRIVTGYPTQEIDAIEAELGYRDDFLVAAEYYYVFVIQGPDSLSDELKLSGANLNIKLVDDITPYRLAKVGVLNGAHTVLVPIGLLAGLESVAQAVNHRDVGAFLRQTIYDEIIPALPLPRAELETFAEDVLRRFRNPYIHHKLESIALNSWPKFAARVIPQLMQYQRQNQRLPRNLVVAFAATLLLYRGKTITLNDAPATLSWFATTWESVTAGKCSFLELVEGWLGNVDVWKADLNTVPGLTKAVTEALIMIDGHGIAAYLQSERVT
jgi:tagaturonate reductase